MRFLYLLIFSFYTQTLCAQSKDTLVNRQLIEVVVTGQISEKTIENAIHKIRIIGSKELNSGLFTDLASVLSKELNIRVSEDNILGSSISIQGISGQNVKILIDDVPAIGRLNGNIDLSQISLNNIQRIEIVEGPLSTIYGTDALAGTINIITKKQSENKKSFTTYYETIGKYNYDFLFSENIRENTATYQFGRNYFNGWSSNQDFRLIPSSELADLKRYKKWKPKEQISHKVSYNIKKDSYTNNNYIERFYEKITNRGMPQEPYYENAFDEYYHTFKTNLGSDIKLKYDKNKVRLILAYNNYIRAKETFYKDLTNLSEVVVQDASMQDTSQFNLWMIKAIVSSDKNDQLRYQLGIDFNKQNAKGNRILNKYQEKSDYAVFSTIEYKLDDHIQIRPAVRLIYNNKFKAPIVPAINALFDWKKYKLRISYAKGFRAPDFKELFFEFVDVNHNIVGNESLLAEESDNFNINTTISQYIFKNKIITDISLFYNSILNKIDLANSSLETNQYSYFNIRNYKTKGISIRSSIALPNTEINFGMSYIGRYNKLSNEYSLNKFNFSSDLNLSLLFQIGQKNKLNIFYKRTGQLPNFILDNNNLSEVYSDAYNILDLSVNRRIYNDLIILTLGAKNLFNITDIKQFSDNNASHSNSNNTIPVGYGRTFFTSLKFKL
jgi:outer membrane receptor for ferrienterochelin and colicins